MSAHILTNSQVVYGTNDLTPFTGYVTETGSVNMVDVTTLGSGGFHCEAPGVQKFVHNITGISDLSTTGINALVVPANVGTQYAHYIVPQPSASGVGASSDPAIFSRGVLSEFAPWGGNIGDASKFSMTTTSDTAMLGGYLLAPLVSRGALTGNSVTMAGPTATQKVYAALFVTGAVGTNLAVIVQSAPASNFASPTTRFTFNTVSAIGWQWATPVAGAITDGFWRCVATVGSSTFTWACMVGVLNTIT